MTLLITGGAGFLGSHFADFELQHGEEVVIIDALTYAGSMTNVPENATFCLGDVCNKPLLRGLLEQYQPRAVFHFAAESHVERSFSYPDGFIHTNVHGTLMLLDALNEHRIHHGTAPRLIHISTDEVYGASSVACSESDALRPGNPYSASKASAEMFVMAYINTYGLKANIVRLSNCYGPRQFAEKLIPVAIRSALDGRAIVLHGDGSHVREWLYVTDACKGIWAVYDKGMPGEIYNLVGMDRLTTLQVAKMILAYTESRSEIHYAPDRPGNDREYRMDFMKVDSGLWWSPSVMFSDGLRETIAWVKAA